MSRLKKSRRGLITLACFAASLVATVTLAFASWSASAANATFRIDPSTQTVAPGAQFTMNLVVNSDTPLYGAQTTLNFDASKLEILTVEKGTDWGTASLLTGVFPQTREESIAEANTTGLLKNLARFNSAGVTTPAGPKIAAILTVRARPGAAIGATPITFTLREAYNGNFVAVPTSADAGIVLISLDAPTATSTATALAPSATSTSTITPSGVTNTPTPTPTPGESSPTPTATDTPGLGVPGTLGFSPGSQSVDHGQNFQLAVVQNLTVQSVGLVTDVTFNPALIQLTDVLVGADYSSADLTVGETGQTKAQAIAAANLDGTLRMVLVNLIEGGVNPGPAESFKLLATARQGVSGLSTFQLKNVTFYATAQISVTRSDALVEVVGPATATPSVTPTFSTTPTSTATNTPTPTLTFTATATAAAETNTPGAGTATNTPLANTATSTTTTTSTITTTATSTQTVTGPTITPTPTTGALSTTTPTIISTTTSTQASGTMTVTTTPTSASGNTSTPTTASGSTSTSTVAAGSPSATATIDPASAQAKLSITPPTIIAPPGAEFTVILAHESQLKTSGAQADLKFDPALLQVVAVEKSGEYAKASLLVGVAPQKPADAIAEANTSGTLKAVGAFFVPPTSLGAGPHEFVRIKMQVKSTASNTTTALTLANLEMLNDAGEPISVSGNNGQLTIQAGAAVPTPPGPSSTVAGTSNSPSRLPSAGVKAPYGELNWALTISLIAMLASGGALVGSLAQREEQ